MTCGNGGGSTYTVQLFGSGSQIGGSSVSMGNYASIGETNDTTCASGWRTNVMTFTGGAYSGGCSSTTIPVGSNDRNAVVTLNCTSSSLVPSTCAFTTESPACNYLLTATVNCTANPWQPGTLCTQPSPTASLTMTPTTTPTPSLGYTTTPTPTGTSSPSTTPSNTPSNSPTPTPSSTSNMWSVVGNASLVPVTGMLKLTSDVNGTAGAAWTGVQLWADSFVVTFTFGVYKGAAWSTPTSTATASQTGTATITPSHTPSSTLTPSHTPTGSYTASQTGTASISPSSSGSATQTAQPTQTATSTTSASWENTASVTASHTGTAAASRSKPASGGGSSCPGVSAADCAICKSIGVSPSTCYVFFRRRRQLGAVEGGEPESMQQLVDAFALEALHSGSSGGGDEGGRGSGGAPRRRLAVLPATLDGDVYGNVGEGLVFAVQRDPRGARAIGAGSSSLGFAGIGPAFGIRFDTRAANITQSTFGFVGNGTAAGASPGGSNATGSVTALPDAGEYNVSLTMPWWRRSGYSVTFSYSGPLRSVNVTVTSLETGLTTTPVFNASYAINLPAALGCPVGLQGCDAYFGFTAATGVTVSASQEVSSFGYLNVEPTASITPSQTPSSTPTASVTSSSTPTASRTSSLTATSSLTSSLTPTSSLTSSSTPTSSATPAVVQDVDPTFGMTALSCPVSSPQSPSASGCASAVNLCSGPGQLPSAAVKQPYASFALGPAHGCGIDAKGDARCFGSNTWGQAPRQGIAGPFAHIDVVADCSCGLRRGSGNIVCWGNTSRPGCPALLSAGAPFRHFALSGPGAASFLLAVNSTRGTACLGNATAPGCVSLGFNASAHAVAAAGGSACVLSAAGDGSLGGAVRCYGVPGMTAGVPRAGGSTYGTIAAAGASTYCAVFAPASPVSLNPPPAGSLDCWGPNVLAMLPAGLPVNTTFRSIAGSVSDNLLYAVADGSSGGVAASFDGAYDNRFGCAGAPCACSPGSAACDARSATSPSGDALSLGAPLQTTGLTSPLLLTCGLTCAFSLSCFGGSAADPQNAQPSWLGLPCALAVPQDVGTNTSALAPASCGLNATAWAASTAASLTPLPSTCNLQGLWNNGTLLIEQTGNSLALYPLAPSYGGESYANLAYGEPAVLYGAPASFIITNPFSAAAVVKGTGAAASPDCSSLALAGVSGGSLWTATTRCPLRYLRIRRGAAGLTPPALAALPVVPTSVNGSAPGQPALFLGGLSVLDASGADITASAWVSATSTSSAVCGAASAAGCLSSGAFATAWAWGTGAADPWGWLTLDFGANVYVSSVTLLAANATTLARALGTSSSAATTLAQLSLGNVTVTGYDDRNIVGRGLTPAEEAALLVPSVSLTVAGGDLAATPGSYTWSGIHLTCGFDPRASASATPSVTPTPTATYAPSPSGTPSHTPSGSSSASDTPAPTVSSSRSATPSLSSSATPSPSHTASTTPTASITPSSSPTAIPAAFRNGTQALSAGEAQAEGAAADAAASAATAQYNWRTDPTLTSLAGAPETSFSPNTTTFAFAWEPFVDAGSGVASVAYCLGSAQFACDVADWVVAPTVKTSVDYAVLGNLSITPGSTVYATVAAANFVGLVSMTSSAGVRVDDRPPALGRVLDTGHYFLNPDAAPGSGTVLYRPAQDIDCDVEGGGVGAVWRDAVAPAGIGYYEWAVGRAPNATDILPWTNLGTAVAVYNASLFVPRGATYFASLRSVGVNGLVDYGASNGVRVLGAAEAGERMVCLQTPPAGTSHVVGGALATTGGSAAGVKVSLSILSSGGSAAPTVANCSLSVVGAATVCLL